MSTDATSDWGAYDSLLHTRGSIISVDPGEYLQRWEDDSETRIDLVPLSELPSWSLGDDLSHSSGRFFSVIGVASAYSGPLGHNLIWMQPAISQPEVGILGLLGKRLDGVLHFLMQMKMEPGNAKAFQFAPTVQATPSNYERVHGGRETPYLTYFTRSKGRVCVFDQVLSEHGQWYLRKRNRNMIVLLDEREEVPLADGFVWLTLGQIREVVQQGERVNLNARSVLAGIDFAGLCEPSRLQCPETPHRAALMRSFQAGRDATSVRNVLSWLHDQRGPNSLHCTTVALRELDGWDISGNTIHRRGGGPFSIVGARVTASTREIAIWHQPLLQPSRPRTVVLVVRVLEGVVELLLRVVPKPGLLDAVEFSPTAEEDGTPRETATLIALLQKMGGRVIHDSVQTEDGGRFLNAATHHVIVEVAPDRMETEPPGCAWLTMGTILHLMRSGYYIDVDVRSLITCLF